MSRDLRRAGGPQALMVLGEEPEEDVLIVFGDPAGPRPFMEGDHPPVAPADVAMALLEAQRPEPDLIDQQRGIGRQARRPRRRYDPAAPAERTTAVEFAEIVHPHQAAVGSVADDDE